MQPPVPPKLKEAVLVVVPLAVHPVAASVDVGGLKLGFPTTLLWHPASKRPEMLT